MKNIISCIKIERTKWFAPLLAKSLIKIHIMVENGELMADLFYLLNKAIEKELSASIRYMWQSLAMEKSDVRNAIKENAVEKLRQAIIIGEHLFSLGDVPTGIPKDIGRSMKEMIVLDLKAENELTKAYQEIIEAASKNGDAATRSLFEGFLHRSEERRRVLMCAGERAARRIV